MSIISNWMDIRSLTILFKVKNPQKKELESNGKGPTSTGQKLDD